METFGNHSKTIVITGSTRGIGFALADSFLRKGCSVVISGRKDASVKDAIKELKKKYNPDRVRGAVCDVREIDDLQKLWDFAFKEFQAVDIWINNAGISNTLKMIEDIPAQEVRQVVETNVLGEIFGSQVALRGFQKQGHGALYNMEGMGAKKGRMVDGLSIYGTTKSGLRYFNDAIAHENKHAQIIIGALLPGMVLTDMVTGQYVGKPDDWDSVKGIFQAISEDVQVVADWLVNKMLAE